MKPVIELKDCEHRRLYRLRSRNLSLGVFNKETNGFIGMRTKFGDRYAFTEFHIEYDGFFKTARPFEALPEMLPDEIPVTEGLEGTDCGSCPVGLRFEETDPVRRTGVWVHVEPSSCKKPKPYWRANKKLVEWLLEAEKRYPQEGV